MTDMGQGCRRLMWLSAVMLAGCSLSTVQPSAMQPSNGRLSAVVIHPNSGETYRLPTRDTLAALHRPRIVLATAVLGSPPAAMAVSGPPAVIHTAPARPVPVASAAPPTALRLDHEFASISRMEPFASGRATLGPSGRKAVAERVPMAREAQRLMVRDGADARAPASSHEAQAGAGARTVASIFLAPVAPADTQSTGRCVDCFVATNATAQGRRLNRRVDVEMNLPKARIAQQPRPVYALDTPPLILARTLTSLSGGPRP